MQLEFVNHASLIYAFDDVRLIADPWIEGTVFDNSWAHVSEPKFTYNDYEKITHIWFSHEHPDHFFPPNIKKIPEEFRAQVTVLFKQTLDKKVVNFCRNLGFKQVIELPPGEWCWLTKEFGVLCQPYHDDSALIVVAGEQTIVNANDCVLDSVGKLSELKSLINRNVDVLLTQFSYASYVGETYEERREHAKHKFEEMNSQINFLAPRFVIPFASYVYFCHEDNFHMNDAINRIDTVYDQFRNHSATKPIVLYPGDEWIVGEPHDSERAVQRYVADHEAITDPLVRTVSVDPEALRQTAVEFHARLEKKVDYLSFLRLFQIVKPLTVFVKDLGCVYQLGLSSFEEIPTAGKAQSEIAMSSQTLNFCMKFDYGWNTTSVNGKFEIYRPEALKSFRTFMSLGDAMNHGRVTWWELLRGIQRRLSRRLWPAANAS